MPINLPDAEQDIVQELDSHGLKMTSTAMAPLRAIDFARLVDIHDHEEHFLRETFVSSLLSAHQARVSSGGGQISVQDVRTAMLMLGAAVSAADAATFSSANKPLIRDICPYCKPS